MVSGRVDNLRDGFDVASKSVLEGRAQLALERLVELSNA
jgi:anthranilate phosphoribosyltransferase